MQGISAGAAVNVGICISVSACSVIGGSMPSVAVASNICVAVVCTLENGQIQCVHIIAARTGLAVVVSVCSRWCVADAVPIVALACSNMIGCVAVVADGQVQCVSAGTAFIIDIGIGVNASGIIRGSMPSVVIASIGVVAVMRSMVNCQVEEYKTIASGHVGS